ncbi:HAMP domain-containing histidine kinase [Paenisporosarcina quisquiliarum]|uniref:histidine kinase n=1 Tax=Paenisporosarcina quisquiliarum TaxID=365346 RepID=A0A9X3LI54_9BACL|nr:HAMP domain-containing sensor histidine kinase [Paenisporosarcina quisquiliarum]MCZ8538346.1 HAMP domain-containing histidine kinase [Paenisporosarcina quisquiliarum]
MKKVKVNFNQKIILLFIGTIAFSVAFSFLFLHFLYKDLYLNSIRESVEYQGEQTAAHYHYGELTDEIIGKIQWYNIVSEYEVIVVNELDELNASFPYSIGEESLVAAKDRDKLMAGQSIMKEGYVAHFQKEVIGAIYPVMDGEKAIGYIFIYVPLAGLSQVFGSSIPILLVVGTVFFLITSWLLNRIRKALFQPLLAIQDLSKEVSKGQYSNRINIRQMDEIGQMAQAFNDMSEALEHQDERKRDFLANMVHEMRTPLTYINGYTEVLQKQTDRTPEETHEYLQTIQKEVSRMKKLLADLVELNYLQEDLFYFEHNPIVVAQLLFDTCDLFRIHRQNRQIDFDLNVDEDLIVFNDEKRLQQIFYNVIDNAVKYSNENSVIGIVLARENQDMLFTVINKGTPISQQDIERLGERFFRTDKARNRQTGGTGLGLSIVKEIVRIQKGTFEITSTSTGDISVTIRLPIELKQVDVKGRDADVTKD